MSSNDPQGAALPPAPRELILVASPEAGLRARGTTVASAEADAAPLERLLVSEGISVRPLFGHDEERVRLATASVQEERGVEVPELSVYYRVRAPEERLEEVAAALREQEVVEAAYVKPPVAPAVYLNEMPAVPIAAPSVTPDFGARQGYLDAAPVGIDARHAWTLPGGGGAGVRIIDIEGAWRFTHEDLTQNQGGVVGGASIAHLGWRNHGTAVIGEFSGDRNGLGVTGICPDAGVSAISVFPSIGSAAAIRLAADRLGPGDVLLIELHRPGPRLAFADRPDQRGFIAVEWWPDDYSAIRYAVGKGIVVVEAAGNGAENLDDPLYDINPSSPHGPFPSWWRNPFRRSPLDSGAIVVGAGAPPPGTHGRSHGPDRSRLDFSNHGALVDAQGWGREVTTCGYGDLQGGPNEDLWYTDQFSGTSSASPIVVGALGCVQGILRARGRAPLDPAQARSLLRSTGSPQQAGPQAPVSQRIGNRPDVREMVARVSPQASAVPLYRYWNAGIGDHFYTTAWSELESGKNGWVYEGVQCYVFTQQQPGTVPLYRYWSQKAGDHFYTTSWNEMGGGKYGWTFERIQCYVHAQQQAGSIPLYRYWNKKIGDHYYTTQWSDLGSGKHGWKYEGVVGYVHPQPVVSPPSVGGGAASAPSAELAAPSEGALVEVSSPVGPSGIPETFTMGADEEVEAPAGPFAGVVVASPGEESPVPESFRVEGQGGASGGAYVVQEARRGRQVTVTVKVGGGEGR